LKKALQRVLEELGNPFQEETADLLVLDTKTIADLTLAGLVGTHQERGKQQFKSFVDGLEIDDTSSFYHPIKKNKVARSPVVPRKGHERGVPAVLQTIHLLSGQTD